MSSSAIVLSLAVLALILCAIGFVYLSPVHQIAVTTSSPIPASMIPASEAEALSAFAGPNVTHIPDPDNPFIDYKVDFGPFRKEIKRIMKVSGKLKHNSCSIPDGAFIFTLSNQHMMPLLTLRHTIMKKAGVLDCLRKRFITVCLDKECLAMCKTNGLPNCMHMVIPETPLSGFGTAASAYQKNSYNYIVWVKYEMFVEALKVTEEFFYFDADVMVFKNPFPDTRYGRDNTGAKIEGRYDIMYQRERGMKERGCGGSVNGGLYWLRNSTALHERFFPAFMKHREEIINLTGRLDQDIIGDYVRLVRFCTLPTNRFMGHCISSQDQYGYSIADMVTFHTNCVAGMEAKINAIRDFAHAYFGHPVSV
jgi:hypothetical protein